MLHFFIPHIATGLVVQEIGFAMGPLCAGKATPTLRAWSGSPTADT